MSAEPLLVAVGEAMLEFTDHGPAGWRLGVGGDTFNTIVQAARLGVHAGLLTAVGSDAMSGRIRDALRQEGVDDTLALTHPGRLPGLYLVENPPDEDRRFHYWRNVSAARAMFACAGADAACRRAARARMLHLSGITLAILGDEGRARLAALAQAVQAGGGRVSFDPNWRPRLWEAPEAARAAIAALVPLVDIALPTFEDEAALWGHATPAEALAWWADRGVAEVAIKLGPGGALLSGGATVPVPRRLQPLDATGAGDAFNAAYLAARLAGKPPREAAAEGHALAGETVLTRGAVAPRPPKPIAQAQPRRESSSAP